jgi:hypothetical protein
MLKTDAYFVILLVLMLMLVMVLGAIEHEDQQEQDQLLRLTPANSTARFIAAIMLSGRAMPFPAISNAVPWSGLVRGNGSPSVTFTPLWNACSFNGINP